MVLSTYILAIESSCDETSAAIIKDGKEEIATVVLSQMDMHANFGGVVPEIASRMHIENITLVLEDTLIKQVLLWMILMLLPLLTGQDLLVLC